MLESHLNYCSPVWSQNCNANNCLVILQKNLLELLTFSYIILMLVLYSKKVLFLKVLSSDKLSGDGQIFQV